MSAPAGNAPSWLFSFVDLAFLLLIAMTQVGGEEALDLGEIIVPRLQQGSATDLPTGARQAWQLRIHPPDGDAPGAFQLIAGSPATADDSAVRVGAGAARERLGELREAGASKPLLAPHRDSRSQDLLDAVDMIEDLWPGRRRATVSPMPGQP